MLSPVQESEDEPNERRPFMARHRYQDGCVFQRGIRRKVWVGRWRETKRGKDGKLKSVLRSEVLGLVTEIPTKREAKRLLQRQLQRIDEGGRQIESQMHFSDFVEKYWTPSILPTYRLSTQGQCQMALENHLLPVFGQRRLCDVTRFEVQNYFGKLLKKLSPDTVHGIHRFLRKILADAVEWRYIPANPAKGVKLPPGRRREPPFIEPAQFRDLLSALAEPARTMGLLAMMTSMRIEEILGLRWGRVDLERGVLRVVETCYRGHFSTVKSRRSERQVPLSPVVLAALLQRKSRVKNGPTELVFATRDGNPLGDGNLLKRAIYPTCDRLGMPRVSWHALRHLHGSLLSQLGVPVAVAQAQLGHADPRITLSIYTHVIPGAQRQAVEQLEKHLFPNCSQVSAGTVFKKGVQSELTDSEGRRRDMVGATGIEPMTSTVSR
jgi:integrase